MNIGCFRVNEVTLLGDDLDDMEGVSTDKMWSLKEQTRAFLAA